MASLFLFLIVNPTLAPGTLSSEWTHYTLRLTDGLGMSTLQVLLPGFVKMMRSPSSGALPGSPTATSAVAAGPSSSCPERVSRAAAIPPRPHPASSSLPFFPSPPDCSQGTATRGTSVGGALHRGKFYWTHSPRPNDAVNSLVLRSWPSPSRKLSHPSVRALIRALPGRGMLPKPRLVHFTAFRELGCRVLTQFLHFHHCTVGALAFQALGREEQACRA